jgi:hypothetical protein
VRPQGCVEVKGDEQWLRIAPLIVALLVTSRRSLGNR